MRSNSAAESFESPVGAQSNLPPAPPPLHPAPEKSPLAPEPTSLRRIDRRRLLWFSAAVALLVASSLWFCWKQPPHPDAYHTSDFASWDWWSSPIENNAPARLVRLPEFDLTRAFFRGSLGWVGGEEGLIFHTSDGGRTWTRQAVINWGERFVPISRRADQNVARNAAQTSKQNISPNSEGITVTPTEISPRSAQDLISIYFVNDTTGWAVGRGGTILYTTDAGQSWGAQNSGTNVTLNSVAFVNDSTGWIVGDRLTTLVTYDSGKTWAPYPLKHEVDIDLFSILFLTETNGFITGQKGTLFETTNGGNSWEPIELRSRTDLSSPTDLSTATHVGNGSIWIVGDNNRVIHLTRQSAAPTLEEYTLKAAGKEITLTSVQFTDNKNGWVVGEDGRAFRTRDGGTTWTPLETGTNADLFGSALIAPDRLLAFGARGTILITSPSASQWYALSQRNSVPAAIGPYRRYPAPLYYVCLLGVFSLCFMAYRQQTIAETITVRAASIADHAVADRPLTAGDYDALNFGPLTTGLADFLHNKNTTGPLALAITGAWGSGKSSIMGLLKQRLETKGFRPVWFNAWHHQAEDQLLAALLESIRTQAVPPLLSLAGLNFRLRLIDLRLRKKWLPILLGTALLGVCAALLQSLGHDLTWDKFPDYIQHLRAAPWAAQVAAFLTSLFALYKLYDGLRAFGVDPAKLITSVAEKARLSDFGGQTSLRHRFAREFEEVTTALQPRTMTIFIDDLDRCEPAQVMEVLKSLNFLASSGQCFLVIGMEETAVTNAVAVCLEEQFQTRDGRKLGEDESLNQRWDYAQRWMEKLIQIRINVPTASGAEYQRLLVGRDTPPPAAPLTAPQRLRRITASAWRSTQDFLGPIGPITLALLLGCAGFLATSQFISTKVAPAASAQVQAANPTGQPIATAQETLIADSPNPAPTASNHRESSKHGGPDFRIIPAEQPNFAWWLPIMGAVVLASLSLKLLTQHYLAVVDDSEDFRQALRRWSDYIFQQYQTPRAAKRLINKLRLYAMLMRAQNGMAGTAPILESTIVAFGVLENEFKPDGEFRSTKSIRDLSPVQRSDYSQLIATQHAAPELFRQFLPLVKITTEKLDETAPTTE